MEGAALQDRVRRETGLAPTAVSMCTANKYSLGEKENIGAFLAKHSRIAGTIFTLILKTMTSTILSTGLSFVLPLHLIGTCPLGFAPLICVYSGVLSPILEVCFLILSIGIATMSITLIIQTTIFIISEDA